MRRLKTGAAYGGFMTGRHERLPGAREDALAAREVMTVLAILLLGVALRALAGQL